MNAQERIEKFLRAAPRPPVPETLFDKLKKDIPVRMVQKHRGIMHRCFATSDGAISRWRVAAIVGIMALLPLSYGATKFIKRFITISQLSAVKKVGFPYMCALSPDGKHFAGATINSQLVVIDISTDEQRNLAENCHGPVVWSADGTEIAVISFDRENKETLVAVSSRTGKTRTLMEDPPWLADWSPDGKLILGQRTSKSDVRSAVMVDLENKEETVLAKEIVVWPSSRFSPNGDCISYVTKEADHSVLRLRKVDGTSHVKYSDFPGEINQPIWSPDGTHLIFTGTQKGIDRGRGHKDLWALRVEGNQFVREHFPVLPDVEQMEFYNFSQSGKLVYRTGFQLGGIFVLPVDSQTGKATGAPRQLVRAGDLSQINHCWSPDGKQIAILQQRGKLSFISVSGSEQIRRLSLAEIGYVGRGMSWSPDGRLIAFCGRDREKRTGIFLIIVKTGEVKLLVPLEARVPNFDPTWSPDSKSIAYGYESNVYIVNVEDGKPRRITPPPEERELEDFFRRPVFAPDGRSVAYMANRRILATTIDGKETREIFHLKNKKQIINIFDWSPDGRHIVFTPGTSEIWCVATDGGEPFQIADLSGLGDETLAWLPKWSPKGHSIAFGVKREKYQYWIMENFLPAE